MLTENVFSAILDSLNQLSTDFIGFADRVKGAVDLDLEDVTLKVQLANQSILALRSELVRIVPTAEIKWESREELDDLIVRTAEMLNMKDIESRRNRLLALARDLQSGTVVHRRKDRLEALQELRDSAVKELQEEALSAEPKNLPGLDEGGWLNWVWALSTEENSGDLEILRTHFPKVDCFVVNCEPTMWQGSDEPGNTDDPPSLQDPVRTDLTSTCIRESSADHQKHTILPHDSVVAEPLPVDDAITENETKIPEPESGAEDETSSHLQLAEVGLDSTCAFPEPAHFKPAVATIVDEMSTTAPSPYSEEQVPLPLSETVEAILTPATGDQGVEGHQPLEIPFALSTLQSFDAFRGSHWIDQSGSVESAPWLDTAKFCRELEVIIHEDLRQLNFGEAWIASSAIEKLANRPSLSSGLIQCLANLWSSPDSDTEDGTAGQGRLRILRGLLEGPVTASEPTIRVQLFLQALRPTTDGYLSNTEIQDLLTLAHFKHVGLRKIVSSLFDLALRGMQPLIYLRDRSISAKRETPEMVEKALSDARNRFHVELAGVRSAAGGKIKRAHCKEAWATFIQEISADTQQLVPVQKGGMDAWNCTDMQNRISEWAETLTTIAERFEAKFDDLKKMEKTVVRIADQARAINRLMMQQVSLRLKSTPTPEDLITISALNQLRNPQTNAADECVCCSVIIRILDQARTGSARPLDLPLSGFVNHPELLAFIESLPTFGLTEDSMITPVISAASIPDATRAAAYLLLPKAEYEDGQSIQEQLHCSLAMRHREELNDRLIANLSELDQSDLRASQTERIDGLFGSIADVRKCWQIVDELAVLEADYLRTLVEKAQDDIQKTGTVGFEFQLLSAWIHELDIQAKVAVKTAISNLTDRFSHVPAIRKQQASAALESHRFTDALLALGEHAAQVVSQREVMWRPDAALYYSNPASYISADKMQLHKVWKQGITGKAQSQDSKIRKAFSEFVFSAKRKDKHLFKCGVSEATVFRLPAQAIRECIAFQKWNPCFMPQLADFNELRILTPPVPTENSDFVRASADLVSHHKNAFCILLVPRLSRQKREELQAAWRRKQGVRAAMIDDLDLCNLTSTGKSQGNNPLLGLLEIAFEQQQWSAVDPFRTEDGQKIQMEMFVGRDREAHQLALEKHFSRLFSGRKLGKSALLKYIHETLDGDKTPSGNALRVVYISIVGAHTEPDVAEKILSSLVDRFRFSPLNPGNSSDSLIPSIKLFLKEHPSENFLFVLDEADNFVESQLDEYEKKREECVSFKLRSEIEDITDEMGHPRARFVFSGYRTTNTTGGAWANWGDVLRLVPLDPEDAGKLVAGPLARLGIDASMQAPAIAYRCGYQPAVLLRFGKVLLRRLADRRGVNKWEYLKVTPEDVSSVFNDSQLQEEIRQVVSNNFQQNPVARIIFNTILLMLSELPFGAGLQSAEDAVLERLEEINLDTSWMQVDPSLARKEIGKQIRELAQRQLLVGAQEGRGTIYRLRFPHHLSLLLKQDQLEDIAQEIEALRAGGSDQSAISHTLLSSTVLNDFEYVLREGKGTQFSTEALVVGTQWRAPVEHGSVGVTASLQIANANCYHAGRETPRWDSDSIALLKATPALVESGLALRDHSLSPALYIGGTDLIRWALKRKQDGWNAEIAGVGRLSVPDLRWWFERVRGLDLPIPAAISKIAELTSGIPILVGQIDGLLLDDSAGGVSISKGALDRVLSAFTEGLPAAVSLLKAGPDCVRLTDRELCILRMACKVKDTKSMYEDLTEYWDLYKNDCAGSPAALSDVDWLSVSVLEHLGLLPCDPNKLFDPMAAMAPVAANDALRMIVESSG